MHRSLYTGSASCNYGCQIVSFFVIGFLPTVICWFMMLEVEENLCMPAVENCKKQSAKMIRFV
jgi:hypothetical protein